MKTITRLSTCLLTATAMTALTLPQAAYAQVEDEVITVGTLIKRKAQSDRASPVVTLGEEDISSIGAKNIADLTQTLTINTGAENNPDAFTQNGTTGTSNINLRGLGVQSTLVLLNGRRQVLSAATNNGGFQFVDTSSLVPLIAVENVEILKDGASATYGSDAVAGVANFTTFNDYDGIKLNGQYQFVDGTGSADEILLQAMAGKNFERGNIMGAVSYTDRSPLTTAEKRLSRPQDDSSSLGNPGAFVPLVGPLAGVPLIDSGCAANGGAPIALAPPNPNLPLDIGLCGFDFGSFFNLIAEEERLTGLLQADFEVSDTISWRAEFTYSDNEAIRGNSPTFPFLQSGVVPTTNPNYPAALAALAPTGAVFLGRASGNGGTVSPNLTESETWRFSTAIDGQFNDRMDWRLSYTQGQNSFIIQTDDTLTNEFRCALAGTCTAIGGPEGFFNPFSSSFSTAPNDPAILDYIIGTARRDLTSDLKVIEGVVTSELGNNGAAIALGVQYRSEDYEASFDANSNADNFGFLIGEQDFDGSQDVFALFTELALPLSDTLDVQAALRYESYGGSIGDTLDPKVALLWRPADYLSVRGSFSTSFRAPTVYQQNGQGTALNQVSDPTRGGANTFAATRTFGPNSATGIAAGAAQLSPEQSEAFNGGFSLEPFDGLDIDIDVYKFNFSDVIIPENFQAVVNADPNDPTRVVRSAAGGIVQVNTNYVNASSVVTSGVDFGIKYEWETDFATIVPFFQGTHVFAYDLDDPQAGGVDGAGKRNFTNFGTSVPDLRFNTGFNLIKNNHRLDVFGRYISGYNDDQNAGQDIDSHFTIDGRYSIGLGEYFDALGDSTALTVGVINAFNEDPPQVFTNGGFDSKVHDPRGRLIYVGADIEF